jgi:hypothetical protein
MATQPELSAALKETLKRTGTLDSVLGILRADIYHCLTDSLIEKEDVKRPVPPKENVIINELIADYLAFNGYSNTLSVLVAESGSPSLLKVHDNLTSGGELLGPNFIRAELGVSKISSADSAGRRRKPLAILYEVVAMLKARNRSCARTSC